MFITRRSCVGLVTIVGAAACLAVGAPGASAAQQLYVGPNGYGFACSSAYPCDIVQAVKAAGPGDEVIVKPGLYAPTGSVDDTAPITIRGEAGQPRPVLAFGGTYSVNLTGSTLSHVEISQLGLYEPALIGHAAIIDQVVVRGGGAADCAASLVDTTIRNSVVVARSSDGSAICSGASSATNTTNVRNVTAVAHTGVAIEGYASGATGGSAVNVVNTIARTDPQGLGLWAHTETAGAHSTITVAHSNYANSMTGGSDAVVVPTGGNQGSSPTFVDEAAGDYRQKPVSVTIDAGVKDVLNGPLDLDGDPRNVGPPDIGADEYVVPPTATTNPATAVTDAGATLAGSVDPKRAPTSYRFEYGTTTAYGQSTAAADAGSGSGGVAVAAPVSGLAPATTYHYRVVASNAAGVAQGGDRTFTTAPAGAPGTSGAAGTPGSPGSSTPSGGGFAGVKLVSTKLAYAHRSITLRLSCRASTAGKCTGRTKLTARRRSSGSRSATVVTLGRARFSVAPGKTAKVKVRVTRAGRRLFAGTRRLRGRDASAAHDGAGLSKTTVAAVRIRKGTG
jgi:hypothetical protein